MSDVITRVAGLGAASAAQAAALDAAPLHKLTLALAPAADDLDCTWAEMQPLLSKHTAWTGRARKAVRSCERVGGYDRAHKCRRADFVAETSKQLADFAAQLDDASRAVANALRKARHPKPDELLVVSFAADTRRWCGMVATSLRSIPARIEDLERRLEVIATYEQSGVTATPVTGPAPETPVAHQRHAISSTRGPA